MRDEELMKQASKTGSLGLAESLYKQLSRRHANERELVGEESAE
jgi:Rod binding domain-containing protein